MSKKKVLIFIFTMVFFLIAKMPMVNAASLTISLSNSTANSGDTISVKVNGNGVSGKVALSASEGGSISPSSVWVDNSTESATLKITGDKDVTITATPVDASNSNDAAPYTSSTGATVKVKSNTSTSTDTNLNSNSTTTTNENSSGGTISTNTNNNNATIATKKSNNADLKNLGITPNDFKGFKPATTSYNVTVPNNIEKVTVYAYPSDSKATVSGSGAKKLEVGKNAITVTVTAEDETQKTYTINVTREEKEADNTINNTVDDKTVNETTENSVSEDNTVTTGITNSDLEKLEIVGFTLTPKFSPDVFEYNLKVNEDVNDLDVEAKGASSDINVEVVGNKDLKDGENVVTIMVYNKKTDKTTTYQVIVEKTKMETEEVNYNDAIQKAAKIRRIALSVIIVFILFVIIIVLIIKRKLNSDSRADQYEYEEEDEEKLNLDEEDEFFYRVNKAKLKKTEKNENEDIIAVSEKNTSEVIHKKESKPKEDIKEISEFEEDDDTTEYFRTSKSSKKGKHF